MEIHSLLDMQSVRDNPEKICYGVLDLSSRQRFIAITAPLHNYARKVASRLEYENIDTVCLMLNVLAFVAGCSRNPQNGLEGPSRQEVVDYLTQMVKLMDPELPDNSAIMIARETLRGLDNRSTELDRNGEAFSSRWFNAPKAKWEKLSFRLMECATDCDSIVRYQPTEDAFIILSRLAELKSEDRAALQASFLAKIMSDDKKQAEAETLAEGLALALAEQRGKIMHLLKELCQKTSAERWKNEMMPMLDAANTLLFNAKDDIVRITDYFLDARDIRHYSNHRLSHIAGQVKEHWDALYLETASAPEQYMLAAKRRMRFRGSISWDPAISLETLLLSSAEDIDAVIEENLSFMFPPVCPKLADFPSLFRLLSEKESVEPIIEEHMETRKCDAFIPQWSDQEIRETRDRIMQAILDGAPDLEAIFEILRRQGAEVADLKLTAQIVFSFFVAGTLREKGIAMKVEGTISLPGMGGDAFSFRRSSEANA